MAINTNGSNLQVVTNVQGNMVDNDEWLKTKSYVDHHSNAADAVEINSKALDELYNPQPKIKKDSRVTRASNKDLRNRAINTNTKDNDNYN